MNEGEVTIQLTVKQSEKQLDYMVDSRLPDYEYRIEDGTHYSEPCKLCDMAHEFQCQLVKDISLGNRELCNYCILGNCDRGESARDILDYQNEDVSPKQKKYLRLWSNLMKKRINKNMEEVGSTWRVG